MRDVVVRSEVELAVRDHGGEGRPIVFAHGLSSNLRVWDAVIERLGPRFRRIAFDQRSHGRSQDAGDHRAEQLGADVEAVATSLRLRRPVVVGHSWGATTALAFAARAGDACAGVVCVDGGIVDLRGMGVDWEQASRMLRPPELEGTPTELLDRIRAEQEILPWDLLEPVLRRSFVTGVDGVMRRRTPVERHMAIVRRLWEARPAELYSDLRCPALVVLAAGIERSPGDQVFVAAKRLGAERLAEVHPEIGVAWLESVHDIPLLNPGELAALVASFVDGLDD